MLWTLSLFEDITGQGVVVNNVVGGVRGGIGTALRTWPARPESLDGSLIFSVLCCAHRRPLTVSA